LQAAGEDVLVVVFNHSLIPWLRDLVSRFGGHPNQMTFLNFHDWCRRVMHDAGAADEYRALWRGHFDDAEVDGSEDLDGTLTVDLPRLVLRTLDSVADRTPSYDAILVDEGQDFTPDWWERCGALAVRAVRCC
jgi:hypothetical protein